MKSSAYPHAFERHSRADKMEKLERRIARGLYLANFIPCLLAPMGLFAMPWFVIPGLVCQAGYLTLSGVTTPHRQRIGWWWYGLVVQLEGLWAFNFYREITHTPFARVAIAYCSISLVLIAISLWLNWRSRTSYAE